MEDISWKLIEKCFTDNPNNLVAHHLESYNDFFKFGIIRIFRENNPIRFIEKESVENKETRNECLVYFGGKNGEQIYYGTPMIYDDTYTHLMYPNDARLRNMTYGFTIHYDVEVDFKYFIGSEEKTHSITLPKIFLGKFPIMIQSNLCVLQSLSREIRFNMGECRNDYGGYFIIDGKEKVVVSQEKFANNMLYIRKGKKGDIYNYSAEIKSVSEDTSKQIRTTGVKMVAPSATYSNNQIMVVIPNVRKPIPLFILMRALGLVSDKEIIEYCLLDIKKNHQFVDLFIPSIHDASKIFNQTNALKFISTFTKRGTVSSVMEILSDFFLPHIGELNWREKAYFVGYMVMRMLNVSLGRELPTDRDSFFYKRIELTGSLLNDLFREYFLLQKREIALKIDQEYYYHKGKYKNSNEGEDKNEDKYKGDQFIKLIETNVTTFFKNRIVEAGFRKAFKGNWGSSPHTKRMSVVQDLNRLSWNSFISQLRKINLPLDPTAKVVGPRHLHGTQWGFIDPVDTPDGGNIGLHKHLAILTRITSNSSAGPVTYWLRNNTSMKLLCECRCEEMAEATKIIINGRWVGIIDTPLDVIHRIKLFRRNGIIPVYTSISFEYKTNELRIFTDAGRLIRPVYYVEDGRKSTEGRKDIIDKIETDKYSWSDVISGFKPKKVANFNPYENVFYEIDDLYPELEKKNVKSLMETLDKFKSVIEFLDTSEEENALISPSNSDALSKYNTHVEIDPSLMFGVMGNLIVYPEYNQFPRDVFSCGQSKQAVSMYHSNYQNRIDKMGVVLHYGQTPLIKSRYLEYVNNEEHPYGVNTIVAIMSHTGYNVEDAILINQGAIDRGLFRTTYFSMYEAKEEVDTEIGKPTSRFGNIDEHNVLRKKIGCDYSHLDKHGIVKEGTHLKDDVILIGKMLYSQDNNDLFYDDSVKPKKGQLGVVDKTFITEGDEGNNIAKVKIREERIPAIGDKMSSRCGQKGTIGLIIPEENMPFTSEGLRPDLIINPHAIPSRMTIGQILESLFGKLCTSKGGFGDCTAFQTKGSNYNTYKSMLIDSGFHSSGNEILYNGMTGEQINSDIYIGPTYYMRLKHMVKDKINHRERGRREMLTRQTVQGRANDGGLRIGEMERDGILAHGMSSFLYDSFMERGDRYYLAVCNSTGCVAIYNKSRNLFLSPSADGPITFHTNNDGNQNIDIISKYGRSFSIVEVPYSFKLLLQELQVMNIQMRIITEENVSQLMNMKFSNNINKLLHVNEKELKNVIKEYKTSIRKMYEKVNKIKEVVLPDEIPEIPDMKIDSTPTSSDYSGDNVRPTAAAVEWVSPPWGDSSPAYEPSPSSNKEMQSDDSNPYIMSYDSQLSYKSSDNSITPNKENLSQTTHINAPNSTFVISANPHTNRSLDEDSTPSNESTIPKEREPFNVEEPDKHSILDVATETSTDESSSSSTDTEATSDVKKITFPDNK